MNLERKTMVPGRLIGLFLIAFMMAVVMAPQSSFATSREDNVYQALAERGIGRDQVSELNIYSNEGTDGRARSSTAWIRVDQCPQGWVVASLSRSGNVTQVYTRDGCEIPGIR